LATFITGGTGFIGSRLVDALLDREEEIHLLYRKQSIQNRPQHKALKWFEGDVTDKESLIPAMRGCREVYHLAGHTHNWARDGMVYFRVNVRGFQNVAEIALRNGVEKMVFTSTSMTYGPTDADIGDETMSRKTKRFYTDYEQTKYMAEIEAEKFLDKGLPLVIVQPTRVYGPGKMTEGNSVTRMIDMYLHGTFRFILSMGMETGNYVYIDDVVDGHLGAMLKGRIGQRYILGGENSTLENFFSILREVSGRRSRQFHVPPGLAGLVARFEEIRAMIFGSYPLISRGWVKTFLRNWAFSSEKAVADLGYRYRGLGEGLRSTCDWLGGAGVRGQAG